jgi:hypothetical protein
MTATQKRFCRIIGLLGIVCAAFALYYDAVASFNVFSKLPRTDQPVYFRECFVGLTLLAAIIALGVAFGSVELVRLRRRGAVVTTIFACLPAILIFIVGPSWLIPSIGSSIAAASGISLGGLVPMLLVLLPLWSGLIGRFAFRLPVENPRRDPLSSRISPT